MDNQAFYDSLLNQVKGNLNYEETQKLKSLKEENIPVLEEKIQKLKGSIRFIRIAVIAILSLIIISASLIQLELIPKLNHILIFFMMLFPITIGNAFTGANSLPSLQKRIDTFELMLVLTKDEWAIAE